VPLRGGWPGRYARYDWDRDALADEVTVGPAAVVLVEGIYVGRRELRPLYDLRMWVEAARTIRLARGLARDGEAARARWEDEWMPSEDRYVRAHEPRAAADLIVRGDAPTFAVRPAEDADLPGIHEVHVRSIRELARGHYSADEVEAWAGRLPPGIHAQALREHVCEVAVDDSGVLGFAEVDVARGEVRAVYVHPAAARRGVGTLLLARVEERARAAGLTRLVLDASLNAVPFYEHGGFTSDRPATHALEGGGAIRCVRMSKQLPQGESTPPRTT
jgi:putative acetyltransferase